MHLLTVVSFTSYRGGEELAMTYTSSLATSKGYSSPKISFQYEFHCNTCMCTLHTHYTAALLPAKPIAIVIIGTATYTIRSAMLSYPVLLRSEDSEKGNIHTPSGRQ